MMDNIMINLNNETDFEIIILLNEYILTSLEIFHFLLSKFNMTQKKKKKIKIY